MSASISIHEVAMPADLRVLPSAICHLPSPISHLPRPDPAAVREARMIGMPARIIFCCFDAATADLYREITARSA